jgi:hypothetical protein
LLHTLAAVKELVATGFTVTSKVEIVEAQKELL